MQERLTNKQKRRTMVTNKQRWARRKTSNKARRKALRGTTPNPNA